MKDCWNWLVKSSETKKRTKPWITNHYRPQLIFFSSHLTIRPYRASTSLIQITLIDTFSAEVVQYYIDYATYITFIQTITETEITNQLSIIFKNTGIVNVDTEKEGCIVLWKRCMIPNVSINWSRYRNLKNKIKSKQMWQDKLDN